MESNTAMSNNTTAAAAGYPRPLNIIWVATADSPEFTHLCWALTHSSVVALDAEWKPAAIRNHHDDEDEDLHQHQQTTRSFPTVSLLQIACRIVGDYPPAGLIDGSPVFLVDLQSVSLASIYAQLNEMFTSPDILKLGFRFKQDLAYLSSTFCLQGCEPGFDKVEPFLDITSVHHHLMQPGRRASKDAKSLTTVCSELLGIHLSKELQCSDWSLRPLLDEQKTYAAIDAHSLLEIFTVFQAKVVVDDDDRTGEGSSSNDVAEQLSSSGLNLGSKDLPDWETDNILGDNFCEASLDMIKSETKSETRSCPEDQSLMRIIQKYSTKILLKESDKKPRTSRKKVKKRAASSGVMMAKGTISSESEVVFQGPPPWDFSIGGDGTPKFLCDVMVEGLAKHLRCVGIDAAVPSSRKPDSRELIEQANRENRVLLTRGAKLLQHEYIAKNHIYRVKALLKNDQLMEILHVFQLRVSEDQLMSRCTKCNGRFVQKPLSMEEAVEAAKGFQKIPDCLFDKNLEFWQCTDCNQLYWEGTQYHNAVQKFIDVCKLNE